MDIVNRLEDVFKVVGLVEVLVFDGALGICLVA
jgi:hypothetical protein